MPSGLLVPLLRTSSWCGPGAVPAGIVAVIEVPEFTTVVIGAPSSVAVAPVKPVPVMLTVEPAAP